MKKNLIKLMAEVKASSTKVPKGNFKLTCQNVHEYTNKILVDGKEYNKPSNAQMFISEEMKDFQTQRGQEIEEFKEKLKRKSEKTITINHILSNVEKDLSILSIQEVLTAIRLVKKEELLQLRPKLMKLENNLSFMLQEQNLEPHIEEAVQNFLKDLNEIINKATRIY